MTNKQQDSRRDPGSMHLSADVVICGAGIAGVSAAYHLSVLHGIGKIIIVDSLPPLSLTSDKSTECYRNWWPGPGDAMVSLMNRSIDLLEDLARESGNIFHLNRRGYLYLTADRERLPAFIKAAQEPASLGAGDLRIHRGQPDDPPYTPSPAEGFASLPGGADLFLSSELIQRYFPYLNPEVIAALHVRRAGWFSAQQLGAYLLQKARQAGVQVINNRVVEIEKIRGAVHSIRLEDGRRITCHYFVNAAGPFINEIANMLGIQLPTYCELHQKIAFRDYLRIIPRQAPLLIWSDPQKLAWSESERQEIAQDDRLAWMLAELPAGIHTRPEGGNDSDIVLMLWEYRTIEMEPKFPLPLDDLAPEVILRGMTTLAPGLKVYLHKSLRPVVDGGYYTKTRENRPLIGPLPVDGAYIIGALSGFGLMAACAAGELLAAHLTHSPLPHYAPAFHPDRYADPAYLELFRDRGELGQL